MLKRSGLLIVVSPNGTTPKEELAKALLQPVNRKSVPRKDPRSCRPAE